MRAIELLKQNECRYIRLTRREKALIALRAVGVTLLFDYFFYRSVWALLPLAVIGVGYAGLCVRESYDKKREQVRMEFKELLLLASTGLRTGYSMENALLQSYGDLCVLFGKSSAVCILLNEIRIARKNRLPTAAVFTNAGKSMQLEEMAEFGMIYEIAYRKSGNLSTVMDKTASEILQRMELEEAIKTTLNERRFEMRIMNLMPFVMIFYISATSRGYFDGMYHSPSGIAIMSAAMVIYLAAYQWGRKIADIRV